MNCEWGDNKRIANYIKHNADFSDVERFEWGSAIETIDDRSDYKEERWIALGFIDNRLHVLIYAFRGDTLRLISLRKANSREREYYEGKT